MTKVKVRIAVAVDASGNWNSCGASVFNNDKETMDLALEGVDPGERRYWLDAELDVPKAEGTIVAPVVTEQTNNVI